MDIWTDTKHSRPAWNGASLYRRGEEQIIWDGSSRFYALATTRSRFYSVHFIAGMRPEPNLDKNMLPDDFEIHYVGSILLSLKTGYNLGKAPSIDDGK